MSHCLMGSDPRWLNYLGTLKRETQQASLIDTPTHKHTHTHCCERVCGSPALQRPFGPIAILLPANWRFLMSDHLVSPALSAAQPSTAGL